MPLTAFRVDRTADITPDPAQIICAVCGEPANTTPASQAGRHHQHGPRAHAFRPTTAAPRDLRVPSVVALMEIKDITAEDAALIRAIMRGPSYDADRASRMQRIDRVLGTCGVEYIPRGRGVKSPAFCYCNTGDTYALTVIKVGGSFRVTTWGDIVERGNYA